MHIDLYTCSPRIHEGFHLNLSLPVKGWQELVLELPGPTDANKPKARVILETILGETLNQKDLRGGYSEPYTVPEEWVEPLARELYAKYRESDNAEVWEASDAKNMRGYNPAFAMLKERGYSTAFAMLTKCFSPTRVTDERETFKLVKNAALPLPELPAETRGLLSGKGMRLGDTLLSVSITHANPELEAYAGQLRWLDRNEDWHRECWTSHRTPPVLKVRPMRITRLSEPDSIRKSYAFTSYEDPARPDPYISNITTHKIPIPVRITEGFIGVMIDCYRRRIEHLDDPID